MYTIKFLIKYALVFAVTMYILVTILYPWVKEEAITNTSLLSGIPKCLICGLIWALAMRFLPRKKRSLKDSHKTL